MAPAPAPFYQGFGSGFVLDPQVSGSNANPESGSVFAIRIRIRNPDLDPGGQKWQNKNRKKKKNSCFEVLDVLFWELKASSVTWTSFMEDYRVNFYNFNPIFCTTCINLCKKVLVLKSKKVPSCQGILSNYLEPEPGWSLSRNLDLLVAEGNIFSSRTLNLRIKKCWPELKQHHFKKLKKIRNFCFEVLDVLFWELNL